MSASFPFNGGSGGVSGERYFNRGFDFSKSKDFTLRDLTLDRGRKIVVEMPVGRETIFACLGRAEGIGFPSAVMGCPLLKKTRDAAEGGGSFLLAGLGVSLGMTENCDVAVAGRI